MALRFAAVALATLALVLMPAAGAGERNHGVHFTWISFDPPGEDDRSNESLNEEYVVLVNDSERNVNLKGWTIHDLDQDNAYRFDDRFIFVEGARLRLLTGRGRDLTARCIDYCTGRAVNHSNHWDLEHEVWDSDRDRAILEKPDGRVVDRCGYGISANRVKRC